MYKINLKKGGRKERYLAGGKTDRIEVNENLIPLLNPFNTSHQTFFTRKEAQSGLDAPGKAGLPGGASPPRLGSFFHHMALVSITSR